MFFDNLIETAKKIKKRSNFFAAHCRARLQTYAPLTLFFSAEYLSNKRFGAWLRSFPLGSRIPAYSTFAFYLYHLVVGMKQNYAKHPDSTNPAQKYNESCSTARTLLFQLRQNDEKTKALLQEKNILKEEEINFLLNFDMKAKIDADTLRKLYELFHKIHSLKHPTDSPQPYTMDFAMKHFNSLIVGMFHGLTHLTDDMEYTAFTPLLVMGSLTAEGLFGQALMMLGLYSASQAYQYDLQPRTPTTNDLLTCFQDMVGAFSNDADEDEVEEKSEDQITETIIQMPSAETSPLVNSHFLSQRLSPKKEKIAKELAANDANAPCCMVEHRG